MWFVRSGPPHEEASELCGTERQFGKPISHLLAKHRRRECGEVGGHKGYALERYRYWIGPEHDCGVCHRDLV
jgi:hypothetical protein